MKKILFSLLLLLPFIVFAQQNISYSTSFPEPNNGWNKIILMKDGTTVYVYTNKAIMSIRVYDKNRKEIKRKQIPYKSSVKGGIKGDESNLKLAFEQNGNVVLLLSATDGCGLGGYVNCIQSLYRIVIDPTEAKVINGEKLCEAEKVRSWGYNLNDMTVNDIFVAKDPVSDKYAVLVFNGYTNLKDKEDRVILMTFDGTNQLKKSVVLDASSAQAKAIHFAGMCLYDRVVYLGTNMRDTKEKGFDIPLCISVLKDGADAFETKELKISPFAINSDNKIIYNPGSKMLEFISTTETDKKGVNGYIVRSFKEVSYQSTGMSLVDPITLDVKLTTGLDYSLADAYAKEHIGEKNGFEGVMPSVFLNKDNTTTIIPEERYTINRKTPTVTSSQIISRTYISKIALIKVDAQANLKESVVIRIREITGAMNKGSAADYYFDYKYLNTPENSFIVLNDLQENFSKPQTKKPHHMTTISDGNTILYKINGGQVEKSYLWGTPEDKHDNKFAMIGNSTYDENTQTWATIVVDGKTKRAQVAWVEL